MKVVLDNVTKTFRSRDKQSKEAVVAVDHFSLEFPDGKLVSLLGPSGCGKSTALYLLCGLYKPTEGRVFFGDEDVTDIPPESRGVGLVFQNYALYPHMTARQNIMFPLQNLKKENKLSAEEMNRRVTEAARLVQIEEYLERKPSQMSGGQQQRVAIARALVKMPKVLLLDEPLSNLDARLRLQTREEIRRIQKETHITTIFVTHDQDEAMSISDLIVVMKNGKIQQTGEPQKVYDDPCNLFVSKFLGVPPINIFNGSIKEEKVWIGEDCVLDCPDLPEQEVYVGIRPEGFVLDQNGCLGCQMKAVEVMGRDLSVIAHNDAAETGQFRSIIPSDTAIDKENESIRFSIKPSKIYVFSKETEERIL